MSEVASYPPAMIIDVQDLVCRFEQNLQLTTRLKLSASDMQELVTQIFDVLLHGGPETVIRLSQLPKADRMIVFNHCSAAQSEQIRYLTTQMATEILNRMMALGGWRDGGFPYVFDRFLGKDVVLYHLPY